MLFQTSNNHSDVNAIVIPNNNTQPDDNIPTSPFSFITPLEDSIKRNEAVITGTTSDKLSALPIITTLRPNYPGLDLLRAELKDGDTLDPILNTISHGGTSGGSKKRKQIAPLRLHHNKNIKVASDRIAVSTQSIENKDPLPNTLYPPNEDNNERPCFQGDAAKNEGIKEFSNGNYLSAHKYNDLFVTSSHRERQSEKIDIEKDNSLARKNDKAHKTTKKMMGTIVGNPKSTTCLPVINNIVSSKSDPKSLSALVSPTTVNLSTATPLSTTANDLLSKYNNLNFPYYGPPPPAYFQYFLQDHYLQTKGSDGKMSSQNAFSKLVGEAVTTSAPYDKAPLHPGIPPYTHAPFPFDLPPLFPHQNQPLPPPPSRIFNPEAFCELCNKEFCNKYFLKTHKANKHGVFDMASLNNFYANNLNLFAPGFSSETLSGPTSVDVNQPLPPASLAEPQQQIETPSSSSDICPKVNLMINSPGHIVQPTPAASSKSPSDYYNLTQFPFPNFLNAYSSFFPTSSSSTLTTSSENLKLPPTSSATLEAAISDPQMKDIPTFTPPVLQQPINGAELKSTAPKRFPVDHIPSNNATPAFKMYSTSPPQVPGPVMTVEKSDLRFSSAAESYCDLCRKEFCNKYFLRKHKKNIHGIAPSESCLSNGNKGTSTSCNSDGSSPNHSSFDAGTDFNYPDLSSKVSNPSVPLKLEAEGEKMGPYSIPLLNEKLRELKDFTVDGAKGQGVDKNECALCKKVFTNQHFLRSHIYNVHEGQISTMAPKSSPPSNNDSEDFTKHFAAERANFKSNNAKPNMAARDFSFNSLNSDQIKSILASKIDALAHIHEDCAFGLPTTHPCIKQDQNMGSTPTHNTPQSFKDKPFFDPDLSNRNKGSASIKEENLKEYEFAADYNVKVSKREDDCYCDICNKEFSTKYFLRTHKLNAHNISTNMGDTSQPPESHIGIPMLLSSSDPKVLYKPNFGHRPNIDSLLTNDVKIRDSFYPGKGPGSLQSFSQWGSSFCQICQKELCNKYFLKTHMIKMHGISVDEAKQLVKRNSGYPPVSPLVNSKVGANYDSSTPNWSPEVGAPAKSRKAEDGCSKGSANYPNGSHLKDVRLDPFANYPPPPFSTYYTDNGPSLDAFNPMLLYGSYYPYYFPGFGAPLPFSNPSASFPPSSASSTTMLPYYFDGCEYGAPGYGPAGVKPDSQHSPWKGNIINLRDKGLKNEDLKRANTYNFTSTPYTCPYCGVLNESTKALASHIILEHQNVNCNPVELCSSRNSPQLSGALGGRMGKICSKKKTNFRQRVNDNGPNKYCNSILARYYNVFNSKRLDYYYSRRRMIKNITSTCRENTKFMTKKMLAQRRKKLKHHCPCSGAPQSLIPNDTSSVNTVIRDTKSFYSHRLNTVPLKGGIDKIDDRSNFMYTDYSPHPTDNNKLCDGKESYVMQTFRLMPVEMMSSELDKVKSLSLSPSFMDANDLDKSVRLDEHRRGKRDFPLISTIVSLPMARKIKDKVIAVLCMEPLDC